MFEIGRVVFKWQPFTTVIPVSYTHLDVYKRQIHICVCIYMLLARLTSKTFQFGPQVKKFGDPCFTALLSLARRWFTSTDFSSCPCLQSCLCSLICILALHFIVPYTCSHTNNTVDTTRSQCPQLTHYWQMLCIDLKSEDMIENYCIDMG